MGAFGVAATGRADCAAVTVDVVDTVGAGDTFMGTLIDGLLAKQLGGAANRAALRDIPLHTIEKLITSSASAAAITVSRAGADPPWRYELTL